MRKTSCFLETVGNGIETVKKKQLKNLYGQNELAEILGISKGTLSKWLKKKGVSPKQLKGQRKLYDETVIELYRTGKRHNKDNRTSLTKSELLQKQLEEKQLEIDKLKQEIKNKDEQLKKQSETIVSFADKFATLADQAQKLNFADKDVKKLEGKEETVETVSETEAKTVKKQGFWSKLFGKE